MEIERERKRQTHRERKDSKSWEREKEWEKDREQNADSERVRGEIYIKKERQSKQLTASPHIPVTLCSTVALRAQTGDRMWGGGEDRQTDRLTDRQTNSLSCLHVPPFWNAQLNEGSHRGRGGLYGIPFKNSCSSQQIKEHFDGGASVGYTSAPLPIAGA